MASADEKARFWPHSRPGSEYLGPDRRIRQQHHQMDRNADTGLTKPHKSLKSNNSTYGRMRKVKLRLTRK
jgi:hypothetical protein